MAAVPLTSAVRDTARKAKDLRREGVVPCVLYGNDVENQQLQCIYNEIFKAYAQAGESTLVDLDVGGKAVPVLFHAVDLDPATDRIIHVDFFAVDMKKEIEARIPIHFEGESVAVKDMGGVMVTVLDHITVKCLPGDLPSSVSVDVVKLETFQDTLTIGDIVIPEKVVVQEDATMVIATVQEPRKEEVAAPTEEGETTDEAGESVEGKREEASSDAAAAPEASAE